MRKDAGAYGANYELRFTHYVYFSAHSSIAHEFTYLLGNGGF